MKKIKQHVYEKPNQPSTSVSHHKHSNHHYIHSHPRLDKFPLLEITDYMAAEEEAEKHCTKLFHLKDSSQDSHKLWKLPPSETLYTQENWNIPELLKMKTDLNSVKAQLECYDIDVWHKHTHNCNPAHKISYFARCRAKPELLTQAFLKFYEILHAFPLIPQNGYELPDAEFHSLHLCEAPGAFIVALNHFLALHNSTLKWSWLGNTLNPHFEGTPSSECISDDRFILHTPHNWFFGRDETGNLMSSTYLSELRQCVGPDGVSLATADGSIDCQNNPSEQEAMTHCLHLCEAVAALSCLRKGGALVLKKFTFFEAESVNLMYFLSCCFDDVYVYKPLTSKPGNSEVYVVAIGYNGLLKQKPCSEIFTKYYGKAMDDLALFGREQIPSSFLTRIIDCCSLFKTLQVDAIQRNIHLYNTESEWNSQYTTLLQSLVLCKYTERNLCSPIEPKRKIVPHSLDWDKEIVPEANLYRWGGQIMKREKRERLKFLNDQFKHSLHFFVSTPTHGPFPIYTSGQALSVGGCLLHCLFVREGKSFHFVFVSRFCHVNLMRVFVQTFKECVSEVHWEQAQIGLNPLDTCLGDSFRNKVENKEKVLGEIAKLYPKAILFDEGYSFTPHSRYISLQKILAMLNNGEIRERSDLVILNSPLLTRLQNGLFTLISSVFEKVVFHEPVSVSCEVQFIALINLVSIKKGKALSMALHRLGWYLHDDMPKRTFNQVLPLQVLIQSKLHPAICRYNSLYCLEHINSLQILQDSGQ